MEILILNLMPDKILTETQLLRALGTTPLQVNVTFIHPACHISKNTSAEHIDTFYKTYDDIKDRFYDGLIVTGTPVERLPFENVTYWNELQHIFEWSRTHVFNSFYLCWGAQAALYHFHGINKHILPQKLFGIYKHDVSDHCRPLTNGFDDHICMPVSRHTYVKREDVMSVDHLHILIESDHAGLCLIQDDIAQRCYMFNHLEYDADTLLSEYNRDKASDPNMAPPHDYFPDNNPQQEPKMRWRSHRTLLFANWINMVYQGTPYDLTSLLGRRT